MKKILIGLIVAMILVGCSSSKEETSSGDDNENVLTTTQSPDKSEVSGKYFTVKDEYIEILSDRYQMAVPTTKGYHVDNTNKNVYSFTTNNGETVSVVVVATSVPDSQIGIYDLSENKEEFKYARINDLGKLANVYGEVEFEGNEIAVNLGNKEALEDKGVAKENGEDAFDYVTFSFFLDEKGEYPADLMLISQDDDISLDDLEIMARELISTIVPM